MTTRIITGDALTEMAKLPAESVHCCVTSPPYFGLRDYGTASWNGGDPACDHKGMVLASSSSSLAGYTSETVKVRTHTMPQGQICAKCGGQRVDAQLGLEATPDEYVAAMVGVFRDVRRVLRSDGTLWLNIGDSYAGHYLPGWRPGNENHGSSNKNGVGYIWGCKPKDLIGIPWMLAFALRADGWWLRQDIIWSKPNPMPESVTDRCTKAHEYVFMLSKSERYFYDGDAVREPYSEASLGRYDTPMQGTDRGARQPGGEWSPKNQMLRPNPKGRNKRSVWTLATAPYAEAHFATFPPALVEPCILAGCPVGGTVIDPFGGAGTTALVADRLGRDAILIELNSAYAAMARHRIEDDAGMFAVLAAE